MPTPAFASPLPARLRLLLIAAPAVAGLLVVSACSGSGSASSASGSSVSSAGSANGPGGRGGSGSGRFPGATGEIAAETGTTLQVQNSTSQTAVSYSTSTRITNTVAVTAAEVKVGMCALARPAAVAGNSPASSPAKPFAANRPVVAATVTLSDPVNGSCTGGFGGAGTRPGAGGFPSAGASGFRSRFGNASAGNAAHRPSGNRSPGAGFNRGAFGADGLITRVDGSSFVVESHRGAFGPNSSPSSSAAPAVTDITVTMTSTTKFVRTVSATPAALTVGECVTAIGQADDTGAIAARSIAIEMKVDGSCSTDFGRGRGGFGNTNAARGNGG